MAFSIDIMQFNSNGLKEKIHEMTRYMDLHNILVAAKDRERIETKD